MKKIIAMALALVLVVGLSIGGTLAYLTSEDSDINVMTLGNVEIEQIEQEWNEDKTQLVSFTQNKPLYPAVGDVTWADKDAENDGAYRRFSMNNVVDKYVTVKNTGKSDAYVRTIIALEMGSCDMNKFASLFSFSCNLENGSEFKFPGAWSITTDEIYTINGKTYNIMEFVHSAALKPNAVTIPSMLQLYLKSTTTNEDCANLDGNQNGKYDILVLSQGVQTAGFENAQSALDTAFGDVNQSNVQTWFASIEQSVNP